MAEFAIYEPRAPGESRPPSPSDALIRPARPDDATALGTISARREGRDPAEQVAAFVTLLASTAPERDFVLCAELDGRVVGFGKTHRFVHPADPPANAAPEGWYLSGVVVDPADRRRGLGHALTEARLQWIAARSPCAYYFANALNRVTIDLHARFGFVEVTRDFWFPKAEFRGGVGILFRIDLAERAKIATAR
jgi:ribosomal protein S18 acetylase RimI-like enzyme